MVSGGPSWKETRRPPGPCGREGVGLNRSGFAKGRLDRRCGAVSVSDGADFGQLDSSYILGLSIVIL